MDELADSAALLRASLEGDAAAWRRIVDEYTPLLWWVARSYRLDDAVAADVVQTTWLALVQHGHSIRQPERLGSWLSTTARREALARVKAARRLIPVDRDEVDERGTVEPLDERLIDEEDLGAALAAFRRLRSECQELLRLMCSEPPLQYTEIAARVGRPVGSLGPTRRRCLDQLRTFMATEGPA